MPMLTSEALAKLEVAAIAKSEENSAWAHMHHYFRDWVASAAD